MKLRQIKYPKIMLRYKVSFHHRYCTLNFKMKVLTTHLGLTLPVLVALLRLPLLNLIPFVLCPANRATNDYDKSPPLNM